MNDFDEKLNNFRKRIDELSEQTSLVVATLPVFSIWNEGIKAYAVDNYELMIEHIRDNLEAWEAEASKIHQQKIDQLFVDMQKFAEENSMSYDEIDGMLF